MPTSVLLAPDSTEGASGAPLLSCEAPCIATLRETGPGAICVVTEEDTQRDKQFGAQTHAGTAASLTGCPSEKGGLSTLSP